MILLDLIEARVTGDSTITYKESKTKGIITRVTAFLTNQSGARFGRIAHRYRRLDQLAKLIKEKREKLNEETKEKIAELFDIEDKVLTRVIDVASITLTLSKESVPEKITNTTFDAEEAWTELEQVIDTNLLPLLEEIKKKYTVIEEIEPDPPTTSLRYKLKDIKIEGRVLEKVGEGPNPEWDQRAEFDQIKPKETNNRDIEELVGEWTYNLKKQLDSLSDNIEELRMKLPAPGK